MAEVLRKYNNSLRILCLMLFVVLCFNAKGINYTLEQLSIDQGLPGSNIRIIFQDEKGYMWFGIEAVGLCRYDGKNFVPYEFNPSEKFSLSNNFVWDICSDHENLWISTENGLNYFNAQQNKFYNFFAENSKLTDNWALCLLLDQSGDLWIGTNNGLCKLSKYELEKIHNSTNVFNPIFDPNSVEFERFLYQDSNTEIYGKIRISHLIEDESHNIWASTNKGLIILNPSNQKITHFVNDPNNKNSLIFDDVNFVYDNHDKTYIIGTDRGICKYFQEDGRFEQIKYSSLHEKEYNLKGYYDYIEDSKGTIWIGMSEGIFVINPNDNIKNRFEYISQGKWGLTSSAIRDIYEDNSGQVWIATKFGGLFIYHRQQQVFPSYRITSTINKTNRIKDDFILSMAADKDNNLWLGTKNGGLVKYYIKSGVFESYWKDFDIVNPANSNRIECIYCDKDGEIWMGTRMGLNKLNKQTKDFILYPCHQVRSILEDIQGNLWIGTNKGVFVLDKETKITHRYMNGGIDNFFHDENQFIYTMFQDSYNNIWFGTLDNGIYIFNPRKKEVNHYVHLSGNSEGLNGNMIREIFEDIKGRVWIGTKHSGLSYFLWEEKKFHHFNKDNGLPSNTVYCIQDDNKGNIWIGSHHGLSLVNVNTLKVKNFDETHGLQSNIFENDARAKTSKGYLSFGGERGFNLFNPDSIFVESFKASLIINTLKANNIDILKSVDKDTTIYLKHYQNYLDIEFALLDYRNPSRNTYRYKLNGIDKKWIEAGMRNYVSYTDLNFGKYELYIDGLSSNSTETSKSLIVKIIITPPWWKTNLAKAFYIILTILIFVGIYKIATQRANYNNRLGEAKKEIQRNMDTNETKLRFFTNILHELQSPLALISAPIDHMAKSPNIDENEKKYIDLIQKNVNRLTRLIDEIMYFRRTQKDVSGLKVSQSNIVKFLIEVTVPFQVFANKQNIYFNFNYSEDNIELWFDPDKMEKIISNLLMNAFKYTSQGGTVEITVATGNFDILDYKQNRQNRKRLRNKNFEEIIIVSVKDTGKGMSKEQLNNIFQRFYIGDKNDEAKGTGIGLELTKTLVEMHGGNISVESSPGLGSTFTVSFLKGEKHFKKSNFSQDEINPADYVTDVDYDKLLSDTLSEPKFSTITSSKNGSKRSKQLILVVEDNNDLRRFLGENLSEHYNVLLAENGRNGYETAISKVPDLIISDVIMPEMDGIEMCKELKTNIATSHIPIILLTRKTLIEDKITGLKTGADDYVEKPFNLQYLLLRINNIFNSIKKVKEQVLNELSDGNIETQSISSYDKKLLVKCKQTTLDNISDPEFSVVELGKSVGLSRSQLYRKITALTGQTPVEFIYSNRLYEAKKMLLQDRFSIMDVAHMAGFKSSNSFSTVFKKNFGISPKEFVDSKLKQ